MTELQRVLEWLDARSGGPEAGYAREYADAARLLRAMAEDFAAHTRHAAACQWFTHVRGRWPGEPPCDCGLDASRERWRLPGP